MNRRHQQQQLGLVLGAALTRIDALERRLAVSEGRERELRERVESLTGSLHRAWHTIEAQARAGRRPGLIETQAPAHEPRSEREPRRIAAVHAAKRLGVGTATIRRLIAQGELGGLVVPMAGDSSRRVWTVDLAALERLERAASAPGALGTEKQAQAGLLGKRKGR